MSHHLRAHPDFADTPPPRSASLRGFALTPLTPAEVDEDYAAVMGAEPVLTGMFGSWPKGMTLTENLYDLAWHDREFDAGRSFSWIVRKKAGLYIGCAYLFPEMGRRGAANGFIWLIEMPERVALLDQLQTELTDWFKTTLTAPVAITWHRPTA